MDMQFRWTEADDVAARIAWILHRPWKIIRGYWYSLFILCIVVVGLIVKPENWKTDFFFALLALAVAAPSILIMRWRWHQEFKKSPLANVDTTATVDERGITLSALGGQKTNLWVGFSEIYESSRVVILEKDATDYLYLPKSAMNGAQLSELKRLAASASNCKVELAGPEA